MAISGDLLHLNPSQGPSVQFLNILLSSELAREPLFQLCAHSEQLTFGTESDAFTSICWHFRISWLLRIKCFVVFKAGPE